MSISTGAISSSLFCSPIFKAANNPVTLQDTLIGNPEVLERWKKELKRKLVPTNDTCRDFLDKYVPSNIPHTFTAAIGNEFDDYKPVKGGEVDSYPFFIAGLNALLSSFPAEKRVSFIDCHAIKQRFPYSTFADNHHKSYSDIAVSFPGQILNAETSHLDWSRFSMIIELKAEPRDDPLRHRGFKYCKTLVQLAVNGRNLLHAHSFLASFVIGVYGDTLRISRFDHSGAVFSLPLSLRDVDDLRVLQEFFWRFTHPTEGNSVVGCDPTVRRLTPVDEEWLKNRLELVSARLEGLVLSEARRAEIVDEDDLAVNNPPLAYMLLKALDVNGRLFSRATTVWLGIRDTRRLVNGRLIDLSVEYIPPEDLKMRIIKDAWRQLVRRPEKDFYTRLSRIPSHERIGLPNLICGGDLGEQEARRWELHLYGAPTPRKLLDHKARLSTLPTATASSSSLPPSSLLPPPSLFASSPDALDPAHRPLQQTFTWRQARGAEYWHRERSHTRLVVNKVGRPLNRFRNTREMAMAVRDAIQGHCVAMSHGGILHRDVSVNNILIVDDPDDQALFGGFIHDFDYSSMSCKFPITSLAFLSIAALTELLVGDDYGGELKERTGTFYFIATMLLSRDGPKNHSVQHDLESFYWVLLWIVLRYTKHNHPDGQNACPNIFKLGLDTAYLAKSCWLSGETRKTLIIKNNIPLTALLRQLGDLCFSRLSPTNPNLPLLDYKSILAIFDRTLDSEKYKSRWPKDDLPLEYNLPDQRIKDELSSEEHPPRKRAAGSSTGKRKREAKKAQVPDPEPETDMEDESKDFEPYDDIDIEDTPVRGMPPWNDDSDDVIVPSDYAHLLETQPSTPFEHVPNPPLGDASYVQADEVEAVLDFYSGDYEDDEDEVPEAKRHRTTATSVAQPSAGSIDASAMPTTTSRSTRGGRVSPRELRALGVGPAVDVVSSGWQGPAHNTRAGTGKHR